MSTALPTHRLRVAALLGVCLLALLLAGCGSSGGSRTETADTGTQSTAQQPQPSTGVRPAPIVYRPHWVSRKHPVPLLIALHPSGDTPHDWFVETHFGVQARRYGFVVAYLASLPPKSPAWRKVDLPSTLAYVSSEIRRLVKTENVDPKRVYVMGFSAGATTAYFVACSLSSQIAGVAAVSGAMQREYPCHPSHPMTEMLMIGTHDLVPYKGNRALLPATEVAAKWRAVNGCASTPTTSSTKGSVQSQTWTSCRDHTAVALYFILGGRHEYPGEAGYPASDPDSQLPASQTIWSFFAAHPGG